MSTVSKDIADRVIAGEFDEDNIVAILRYENAFNGSYAYKIIPVAGYLTTPEIIHHILQTAYRIHTGAPVMIYWLAPHIKKHWSAEYNFLEFVPSYNSEDKGDSND